MVRCLCGGLRARSAVGLVATWTPSAEDIQNYDPDAVVAALAEGTATGHIRPRCAAHLIRATQAALSCAPTDPSTQPTER
jgi:hypothetical protein